MPKPSFLWVGKTREEPEKGGGLGERTTRGVSLGKTPDRKVVILKNDQKGDNIYNYWQHI